MKKKKRKKKSIGTNRRSSIYMFVMDILFQAVCLFPWIPAGEQKLNIITYFVRMFSSGDKLAYIRENLTPYIGDLGGNDIKAVVYVFYIQIIFMFVAQVIGLVHMALVFSPVKV